MSRPIEDYALVSDCRTGALIGRDGSVDWLCLPRYDSPSTFGALLGEPDHGRWLVAPTDPDATASRHYLDRTFVLVTEWRTATGNLEVTDYMPHGDDRSDLVRRLRCTSGQVEVHEDLRVRFGYAAVMPWVRQVTEEDVPVFIAVAGPDAVIRRGPRLRADGTSHAGTYTLSAGDTVHLSLTWYQSHLPDPGPVDEEAALEQTVEYWRGWASRYSHEGLYHEAVIRSLLVLRALTHEATGGIVAAATTSLPEQFGGPRNWDYRFVGLRDASLSLSAFLTHSYVGEAAAWRNWLLRAVAGDPADVQIMYGLAGERCLPERVVDSLPGYQGSAPVRVGNAAYRQFQGDVIGEVMVALAEARDAGVDEDAFSWPLQRALIGFAEDHWHREDHGIWEVRGARRAFTQSRVMMWAAFDRAVRGVREHGLDGPVERWEALRDRIRADIETNGYDPERGTFVQSYGSTALDASLLRLPQVGFCEPDDPRMLRTVAAIEEDLLHDGLVMRYRFDDAPVDALPPGEHPFLACSFWLAEQYARSGRLEEARTLMDRLVGLANDVGMLAEEYDPVAHRQVGNTPQALTHLALVHAADWISRMSGGQPRGDSGRDGV